MRKFIIILFLAVTFSRPLVAEIVKKLKFQAMEKI